MNNLKDTINNLLNKSNSKDLFNYFYLIAKIILNETNLLVNNVVHEIIEIEFYLNSGEHKDMFTHEHKGYKTGQFRLHGAGIDIAIGDEKRGFGGILIRSIRSEDYLIEGPLKVAYYLIKNMGDILGASIAIKGKENSCKNVFYAPRVGLMLKKDKDLKEQIPYLVKNYRFLADQSLSNEKYMIALSNKIYNQGADENIWDKSTLQNYVKEFEEGKTKEIQINTNTKITPIIKAYLMGYESNKI